MIPMDINDSESLLIPLVNDGSSECDFDGSPNKQVDNFLPSSKYNICYQNMIFPTFMYFLVLFASIPLSYQAIIQQICNEDQGGNDCSSAHVTSRASIVIVYCNIATYAPGLLTTGLYSSVANIYGRKSVMIISLVGVIIYSLLYCFIVMFDPKFYVALAIVASFVMGISGSYTTYIMGAFSYVADSTAHTPEERNRAYSVTESCLYLGKIVGPMIAGLYASYFGYIVPFLSAAVLSALAVASIIYIPESLPLDAATRGQALVLNPLQVVANIQLLFTHSPELGRSPLPSVATAFFLYYFALMGFVTVVYVYMKHAFGWGTLYFGIYDSVNGAIQAVSMLYVPHLIHRIIGRELRLVTWVHIGYFCRGLFWAVLPLLPSTSVVFCTLPILLLTGPVTPYTRTILSNTVQPHEQAQIFAAFSAIESVSTLLSPLFGYGFAATVDKGLGGLMFEVMAGMAAVSVLVITIVRVNVSIRCNLPDQSKHALLQLEQRKSLSSRARSTVLY